MKKKKLFTVCRVCGTQVPVSGSVITCHECGAKSLYPSDIDEETAVMYADAFRYMSRDDFYSALRMFEVIAKTDNSAAAHSGIYLARYGVGGDRQHITGEILFSCKRLNAAKPEEDEALLKAVSLADPHQKKLLSEMREFIIGEQTRLAKEERERIAAEKSLQESEGLSAEFSNAEKRAKELAEKEKREEEALRSAEEEKARQREAEREKRYAHLQKIDKIKKVIKVVIPSLILAAVLAVAAIMVVIPAVKYSSAEKAYNEGNYAAAATAFRELGDYKNSKLMLETVKFYGLKEGDVVEFGSYFQRNDLIASPIEWIVLEASDTEVLLISKYVLDVKKYNEKHVSVTWETSDLRAFLNGDFFNKAFDPEESKQILLTTVKNPDIASLGTKGGNDTEDRVFCLSSEEAEKYLVGKEYAPGIPTAYVRYLGVYEDDNGSGHCWYWLRSPGSSQSNAAKIEYDGTVNHRGAMIHYSKYGVRPSIVVKVEKTGN